MTTTECEPCQQMAANAPGPTVEVQPETDGTQTAEWDGPIGIENQKTGDGRTIESNALRWDSLPVPLRWAMQDFGAHDGAYVVGKIEDIERIDYDEANTRLQASGRDALPESFHDATIIWGSGTHDMGSEYGREAHRQTKEGLTPGISMDLDDIVIREDGGDEFTITDGRVRAATQVAIPAFEGARIAVSQGAKEVFDAEERLNDLGAIMDDDDEAFNWVEDAGGLPDYIKRIKKHLEKKGMDESHAIATAVNVVKKMCATGDVNFPGAQQVNAGSRAEACAAVADWEAKKVKANASSGDTLVASANGWKPDKEWFDNPRLQGPTGVTVDEDGRVYGHIALWGTCHIANPQGQHVCTQPPKSPTNYANFHLGSTLTDQGLLATGKITMNTLHAGPRLSMVDTLHHYEHTGTVGAHVRAGEDQWGIWVAGAALPDVDLVALRAAPISGDWRSPAGQLDMVAALSVNVPGFPVPRAQALVAGGAVQSLVASGVVQAEEKMAAVETMTLDLMDDATVGALRARFREMDRRDAAAALAAQVARSAALETIRRTAIALRPTPAQARWSAMMAAKFAYNPDQWRVPKGNPEGGRWIDMPDIAVNSLLDDIEAALPDRDLTPATGGGGHAADPLADEVGAAANNAEEASQALRDGDGAGATEAAGHTAEALSAIEQHLQDAADSGEIDEDTAAALGEKLDAARNAIDTVANSDLSLLGEGDIGGPGGDIGGGDKSVIGDVPEAPKAPVDAAPAADPVEAAQNAADGLEQTLMDTFESIPADESAAADIGQSLTDAVDAAHGSDPKASDKALDDLERKLQDYMDSGQIDMSDEDAAAVGDRIQAMRDANANLDPEGSAAEPAAPDVTAQDPPSARVVDANSDVSDVIKPGDKIPWQGGEGTVTAVTPRNDGSVNVTVKNESGGRNNTSKTLDEWDALKGGDGGDGGGGAPEATPPGSAAEPAAPGPVADKLPGSMTDDELDRAIGQARPGSPIQKDYEAEKARRESTAPEGVSQGTWDGLTPEQRKAVSGAIADGKSPEDAVRAAKGGPSRKSPWDDVQPDTPAGTKGTPPGSSSQQAGNKAEATGSRLEAVLQGAADTEEFPSAPQVGEALDEFRSALADLNKGVQQGDASLGQQDKAQNALAHLEALLMDAADGPGLSDQSANQIGQALDDMFSDLGDLIASLNGPASQPPPFAARKYARQWLGRRGIVLARARG